MRIFEIINESSNINKIIIQLPLPNLKFEVKFMSHSKQVHMLEDHFVDCCRRVGFMNGAVNEQGGESYHSFFKKRRSTTGYYHNLYLFFNLFNLGDNNSAYAGSRGILRRLP